MEKYDLTYKKDNTPAQVGIGLLVIYIIMYYTNSFTTDNHIALLQISLTLRILFCIWVYNIAKSLNRKPLEWIILCFFVPTITLILMSTLKKIRANFSETLEIDETLKNDYSNAASLLERSFNDKLLSEEEYNIAVEKLRVKYSKLNNDINENKSEQMARNNRVKLLQQLEELKAKNLISEEDYNLKLVELNRS